jgi:hypothetical protein
MRRSAALLEVTYWDDAQSGYAPLTGANPSEPDESDLNETYRILYESSVDQKPEESYFSKAPWLDSVERRIQNSTAPSGYPILDPQVWLTENIASAGLSFFRNVDDLLASEPYIYASKRGDLVAEISAQGQPSLTVIVSPDTIILFAASDGHTKEKVLRGKETNKKSIRSAISELLR